LKIDNVKVKAKASVEAGGGGGGDGAAVGEVQEKTSKNDPKNVYSRAYHAEYMRSLPSKFQK